MQVEEKKRGPGQPPKYIDWVKLDYACLYGATLNECAAILGVDDNTLLAAIQREHGVSFSIYRDSKEAKNKLALRMRQYECAVNGNQPHNVTDRIWLGKQKLGQRDKFEHEHTIAPELMDYYRELKQAEAKMLPDVIEGEATEVK